MDLKYPNKRKHDVYEPLQPVVLTRQTEAEREKAARLRIELKRAMREPLNPGGELSWSVRDRIRKRVKGGLVRQQGYWQTTPRQRGARNGA